MNANKPNKDEMIGFHKGAVSTLAKERIELIKLVQVTEQIMQAHIKALKELGIDLEKEAKDAIEKMKKEKKTKLDERIG
ncbi:MAG: hypothetical protein KKG60_03480 [Nanoarchaeota archaeon]|nr:hypothetical protein [Nanoarchaeota archaeon]